MNKKILDFFEFIYNRESIRFLREKGVKPPWTSDPILKEFKFCNVRRRDDACTKHLLEKVIENRELSRAEVLMNVVMFRFFNFRDFFDVVPFAKLSPQCRFMNMKAIETILDKLKKKRPLYNLAYRICSACVNKKYRPKDKHVQLLFAIEKMIQHEHFLILLDAPTMKEFYDLIQETTPFVGPFLAYQIALDMDYVEPFPDRNEFTDVGPGAVGGVDFIFGKRRTENDAAYCRLLFQDQKRAFLELKKVRGKNWNAINPYGSRIQLSDIENCLCEYRKYYKLKNGITTRIRRYESNVL